jgi:hypothetical protein
MSGKGAAGAARGPGAAVWLQGLACGAVVTLAMPCAVLAGLLLAPGIGAMLLEREPGRPASRVALLCGAALAAAPVAALWQAGSGVGAAVTAASDAMVLAGCWAAQGGGWLVAQLLPVLLRLLLDTQARTTIARLRAERERYESEWGIAPRADGG